MMRSFCLKLSLALCALRLSLSYSYIHGRPPSHFCQLNKGVVCFQAWHSPCLFMLLFQHSRRRPAFDPSLLPILSRACPVEFENYSTGGVSTISLGSSVYCILPFYPLSFGFRISFGIGALTFDIEASFSLFSLFGAYSLVPTA